MSDDRPLRTCEVADRLGVRLDWLYRHIATLRRDHKFPHPLPHMAGRYDPRAIDDWRDYWRRQQPASLADAPAADVEDGQIDWAAELDRRAEGLARGGRA